MKKIWQATLALLMILGVTAVTPTSVSAEIVPGATSFWGVSGLMNGTINDDIDSEVWAMEQMGNRVFVGGRFTHVTHEGQSYSRPAIAAFDAQTGVWIDTFTPDLRGGAVYALQASSDGSRLFVGGDFDQYGNNNAKGLIALNPLTGAIDWSFKARVSGGPMPTVRALDIENDWLYVAGSFDALKNNGVGLDIDNVGRVSQTTGVVDQGFDPVVNNGSVWGIDASPTTANVYLAGTFDSVNGQSNSEGFAAVREDGNSIATGYQKNTVSRNYMQDVETVNGLVFVGGSQHVLSVYRESDWSLVKSHISNHDNRAFSSYRDNNFGGSRWVTGVGLNGGIPSGTSSIKVADGFTARLCNNSFLRRTCEDFTGFHASLPDTFDNRVGSVEVTRDEAGPIDGKGGDIQDIEVVGDRVYVSCHCWGNFWSSNNVYDWDAAETPEGTWTDAQWIHAFSATTGEMIQSFKSGSTNTGTGPWAIHGATNGCLWFGGGVTGNGGQPANGFTRSCEGNFDSTPPQAVAGLVVANKGADSVDLQWSATTDNVGVVGYRVFNANTDAIVASSNSTSATVTGLAPVVDHSFYVKGIDAAGNLGARSNIVVTTVGAVGAPSTCTASNVGTTATLNWDAVAGAADYRVTRSVDGSAYFWRAVTATTTFTDSLRSKGIHKYQIQSRVQGGAWSSPITCPQDLDPVVAPPPPPPVTSASPVPVCTATNVGTTATISWTAAANANDYRVLRSVDDSAFFWRTGTSNLTFVDSLRSTGIHTYSVNARGTDGVWSAATLCDAPLDPVDAPPPPPPPAQVVAPVTCTATNSGVNATITWDASVGAADYRIRRSVNGSANFWRATTQTTTATDTLRSTGLHTYFVSAREAGGAWTAETTCAGVLDPLG